MPRKGVWVIRMLLRGCANRKHYQLALQKKHYEKQDPVIEQLGIVDLLPNSHGQQICAFNFERLRYWLGFRHVRMSRETIRYLGYVGFLPIHPTLYVKAWTKRRQKKLDEQKTEAEENEEQAG